MKKSTLTPFIVAAVTFLGAPSFAQSGNTVSSTLPRPTEVTDSEGWKPHVGLTLGVANPEGNYRSAASYGLDVGYQPYIPFGAGISLGTLRSQAKEGNKDLDQTSLLVNGTYNFGGENFVLKHSYVGAGVGAVFTADGTEAAFAPLLGMDIPVSERTDKYFLSLGANAKYMVIDGSEADGLTLNGIVKYWY